MRTAIGAMLAVLICVSIVQADDKKPKPQQKKQPKVDVARIAQLVGQLGDNKYDTRKQATDALLKIGKPAVRAGGIYTHSVLQGGLILPAGRRYRHRSFEQRSDRQHLGARRRG